MNEPKFEDEIEINENALDLECLRQPELFRKYSKLSAEATRRSKMADEKVKTVRSKLILKAKQGGEKVVGCKVTDQATEAYYRTQEEYQEAVQEKIDLEYEADIYAGAVRAFAQRKDMLNYLHALCIADYFSAPSKPRNIGEERSKTRHVASYTPTRKKKHRE